MVYSTDSLVEYVEYSRILFHIRHLTFDSAPSGRGGKDTSQSGTDTSCSISCALPSHTRAGPSRATSPAGSTSASPPQLVARTYLVPYSSRLSQSPQHSSNTPRENGVHHKTSMSDVGHRDKKRRTRSRRRSSPATTPGLRYCPWKLGLRM